MPLIEKKTESEQTGNGLRRRIKKAVRGIFYTGETDAEIELFTGAAAEAVTQENLLSQIEKTKDTPVAEIDFEDFFSSLVKIEEWFGDEEKDAAQKFTALRDVLKDDLRDLKVYKVGSIELDIYVVGLDAENNLTGIKTQTVET